MTEKMAVYTWSDIQYEEMRPMSGMNTISVVLSQLPCLYQFFHVMGISEMCCFLSASYL